MDESKRRRIMIACVTFETVKISNPVKYYDAELVHLIHYVRDPGSKLGIIYTEFYEEVCSQIRSAGAEIKEHICQIDDFPKLLNMISRIVGSEYRAHPNTDLFINISAGSSEYVAAATIASMMYEKTIPFSVRNRDYTTDVDMVRKLYYSDEGRPIGLTSSTYDPRSVPKITIPLPDEGLVRGLRIYLDSDMRASSVIEELKSAGLWRRNPPSEGSSPATDTVYYHRDFVTRWRDNGWVTKDRFRNRYLVTDLGRRVLDIFYQDE